VVLDDDPTGTQSIADLPVLTSWSVDDVRWALQQPTTAFFVLTNTRRWDQVPGGAGAWKLGVTPNNTGPCGPLRSVGIEGRCCAGTPRVKVCYDDSGLAGSNTSL